MSAIPSLLYGANGDYEFFGVSVSFTEKELKQENSDSKIGNLTNEVLNSRLFFILSQRYVHVFVHEMSHALTALFLQVHTGGIVIHTNTEEAWASFYAKKTTSPWKASLIDLAGPIGNILFSNCKLIIALSIRTLFPPLSYILGVGSIVVMTYEVYNALTPFPFSDFSKINERGISHRLLTQVALLGTFIFSLKVASNFL